MTTRLALTSITTSLTLAITSWAQDPSAAEKDGSYAFGARFASQFNEGEVVIDEFVEGFRAQLSGSDLRLSEEAAAEAFAAWEKSIQTKRRESAAKEGIENLAKAEAFLKENGTKEDVLTTESGLQYTVLKEGTGKSPAASDKVKAHYHGTLADGTVFDSSKERGQPFETRVGGVIKGWQEGLQLMKEGGSYRFFIHPKLAYGERSQGKIPANSMLIFDLDLIEVFGVTKKPIQAVTPPVAIPPLKKEK